MTRIKLGIIKRWWLKGTDKNRKKKKWHRKTRVWVSQKAKESRKVEAWSHSHFPFLLVESISLFSLLSPNLILVPSPQPPVQDLLPITQQLITPSYPAFLPSLWFASLGTFSPRQMRANDGLPLGTTRFITCLFSVWVRPLEVILILTFIPEFQPVSQG